MLDSHLPVPTCLMLVTHDFILFQSDTDLGYFSFKKLMCAEFNMSVLNDFSVVWSPSTTVKQQLVCNIVIKGAFKFI